MAPVLSNDHQRLVEDGVIYPALLTVSAVVRDIPGDSFRLLDRNTRAVKAFNNFVEGNASHDSIVFSSASPLAISSSNTSMSAMIASGTRCSISSCTISL